MKVRIEYGELWPCFYVEGHAVDCDVGYSGYGPEVDIPKETAERWRKASEEFFECQQQMRALSPYDEDHRLSTDCN